MFSSDVRTIVWVGHFRELLCVHVQSVSHSESPGVLALTTQVQVELSDENSFTDTGEGLENGSSFSFKRRFSRYRKVYKLELTGVRLPSGAAM